MTLFYSFLINYDDWYDEIICQVHDLAAEIVEDDPRNILCDVVEKHHATMLVVGSHGYGAIRRYNLALQY